MMIDRARFLTELRLPDSMDLDSLPIADALRVMQEQDALAVQAVVRAGPAIAQVVAMVADAFRNSGRLFYVGAGTSGRLGVLDASECPPTFRTPPEMVQAIMAGGSAAIAHAGESAEDIAEDGATAIDAYGVTAKDIVVGIAAGGTTPFVIGALRRAMHLRARTAFITCVEAFEGEPAVDVSVRLLVGPEVLTGSTRLKAGTATKLALNQITTLAMVQIGKAYENLMVDLSPSNEKLRDRTLRIVGELTGLDRSATSDLLERSGNSLKTAVVMHRRSVDRTSAEQLLERHDGHLRAALER